MPLPHVSRDRSYRDCTPDAEFLHRTWGQRLVGGLARRVRRQVRRWYSAPAASAESALSWWRSHYAEQVIRPQADDVAAALAFGQRKLAGLLAERVLSATGLATSQQVPISTRVITHSRMGSLVLCDDAGLPSLLRTGDALAALLHWQQRGWPQRSEGPDDATVERAVSALSHGLTEAEAADGTLTFATTSAALDRLGSPRLHLPWALALQTAGQLYGEQAWQAAAGRLVNNLKKSHDFRRWQAPLHLMVPAIIALIELGETRLAAEALRLPTAVAQSSGAVPATADEGWVSVPGLAHLARAWYAQGEAEMKEHADRALAWLRRHQRPDGGLPGSHGPGACFHAGAPFGPAVTQFLLASQAQVAAAFAAGEDGFPAEIDTADGRWQAVAAWAKKLPRGARLADVGCGQGRYLRRLQMELPHLKLTGIDLSDQHLRRLPPGIDRRLGQLLNLPASNGEFDAVLCVEAVEHALVPQAALEELCRVLRPGGSLLVIDKDRRRQELSECAPWERWLAQEETVAWLEAWCEDIAATGINHGPHGQRAGLFLAFEATRRGRVAPALYRRAA